MAAFFLRHPAVWVVPICLASAISFPSRCRTIFITAELLDITL